MNRFALIPLLAATLAAPATAGAANHPHPTHGIGSAVLKYNWRGGKATTIPQPPDKPCTFQNRLDIEIIDGVWFECSCEALMVGTVCDWYEVTSPAADPQAARRIKRHATRISLIVARPAVVS